MKSFLAGPIIREGRVGGMDVGRCERGRGVRARGGAEGRAGVWLVDGVDWRWRLRLKRV